MGEGGEGTSKGGRERGLVARPADSNTRQNEQSAVLIIDPPPPLSSLLFSQLLKKRRAAEYSVRRKGKGRGGSASGGLRGGEGKKRRGEGRGGEEGRFALQQL